MVEAHLLVNNGQQFPLDVFAPHVFRDPLDSTAEVGTPFVGVQLSFEMSHRQRACVCAGVRVLYLLWSIVFRQLTSLYHSWSIKINVLNMFW